MKRNRHLIIYSDTDYAADKMSKQFTIKYVFNLTNTFIIYSLMLQKFTALSICKAEYMIFTEADCKTVHFCEFL